MKRQQNNLCVKDLSKIGKIDAPTSSSNYSTCSDENFNKNEIVGESTILSGQIYDENKPIDIALGESLASETAYSETNYPINILDQNIDVLAEDDDVFLDCNESSRSDTNDDSTQYLPIALTSELSEVKSNNHFYEKYVQLNNLELNTPQMNDKTKDSQKQIENKRFSTILEESEITHRINSFRKESSQKIPNRTGGMVVEVINKIKECHNLNNSCTKKVLFVNEDNTTENVNQSTLKKQGKSSLLCRKDQCCSGDKTVSKNCNVHNTTESFVVWERICKASEKSQSSFSECYGGDDEDSTTFKTLDQTFLSNSSIDVSEKTEARRKCYRPRSNSCDSILREVRHLPHKILDEFLKCLGEEIENVREKICTCKKNTKINLNKENTKSTSVPVLQVQNLTKETKNPKLQPKVSLHKIVDTESRLSPRSITNNSENISRIPKSPRTPTNISQKRGFYSRQKEIVSPVGEYIRGKRESPFKNSPSKKKI